MKRVTLLILLLLLIAQPLFAARAKITPLSKDPYVSALVIDAESGKVLISENADAVIYPASVLKLMDLLVILEEIEHNRLQMDEMVQVTKEAAQMGGSQVYLDPKEQFSVEELLYALMVQSANDAAVALATHVAGSKAGFVAMMNQKAAALGMKNTSFHSVHGLPPSKGQQVDVTTASDLALLSRELAKKEAAFKFTGVRVRDFRDGKFIMRTHNHLLEDVNGCDGFKTGYFTAAGFSIVATAKRRGIRIISIVLGSKNRKVRDAKAMELLEKGFAMIPPKPVIKNAAVTEIKQPAAVTATEPAAVEDKQGVKDQVVQLPQKVAATVESAGSNTKVFLFGVITGLIIYGTISFLLGRKKRRRYSRYSR